MLVLATGSVTALGDVGVRESARLGCRWSPNGAHDPGLHPDNGAPAWAVLF